MSTIIPPHLVKKLNKKYKLEERPYFFTNNSPNTGHCIRINPLKRTDLLHCQNRIPWCEEGYFSATLIKPQSDPLFHAGCYCLQDPSSMFIAHILKTLQVNQSPIKVLDILGGPGLLGTLLIDNTHPESLIVVNENNQSQLKSLVSTLKKWGNINSFVSKNAPSTFSNLPAYFDMVLVYPPNLRTQQPNRGTSQSHETIGLFDEQQRQVLTDSLNSLKTGGILIYAIHSATEEENEEIVNWLCAKQLMEPLSIKTSPSWGVEEKTFEKRTIGFCFKNRFDNQPFFVTALRKKKAQKDFAWSNTNTRQPVSSPNGFMEKWIKTDVNMCTVINNNRIHLFPRSLESDFNVLQEHLTLKKTGICMGKFAENQFIPHKSLAFSTLLHSKIPKKTLSKEDALHFIKKGNQYKREEGTTPTLLTYEGFGLGWS